MTRPPRFLAVLPVILALAWTAPALAAQQQKNSSAKWTAADVCARKAFAEYPDYTPDSNAKRENARRACLRSNALPAESGPAAPTGN